LSRYHRDVVATYQPEGYQDVESAVLIKMFEVGIDKIAV